jgi:hypothetical protein
MSTGQGTITFNFGAAPGTNIVSTAVADAAIGAASNIEIFLTGLDSTATHNAYEHGIVALGPMQLAAISRTAGVGFTGQAATPLRLTGTILARYVWAD